MSSRYPQAAPFESCCAHENLMTSAVALVPRAMPSSMTVPCGRSPSKSPARAKRPCLYPTQEQSKHEGSSAPPKKPGHRIGSTSSLEVSGPSSVGNHRPSSNQGSLGWKQTSFTLPVCPGSLVAKHGQVRRLLLNLLIWGAASHF